MDDLGIASAYCIRFTTWAEIGPAFFFFALPDSKQSYAHTTSVRAMAVIDGADWQPDEKVSSEEISRPGNLSMVVQTLRPWSARCAAVLQQMTASVPRLALSFAISFPEMLHLEP